MTFEHILGQAPAVETLERALRQNRVHHAYRFEGPDGVGKEMAALALAQALLCPKQDAGACGSCSSCARVLSFSSEPPEVPQHPDVVLVARGLYSPGIVTAKESNGISVEQIRKVVLSRAGYAPHEGQALVFIVRDAEELTVSAANALLKTLEEPDRRVHFVLLTSRTYRLLDTIRSRTQAVRFGPLPDSIIEQILVDNEHEPEVASMAQGSAARALTFAQTQQLTDVEQLYESFQQALSADGDDPCLRFAGELPKDRHQTRAQLLVLGQQLALRARRSIGHDPDQAFELARQHGALLQTLEDLERNSSIALAVEALLLNLRQQQ